jgi:hypothetical protein
MELTAVNGLSLGMLATQFEERGADSGSDQVSEERPPGCPAGE